MTTVKELDARISRISEEIQELKRNGWSESGKMVLAELKRQSTVQERQEERLRLLQENMSTQLSAIQIAIVSAQNDTHTSVETLEQKISAVESGIGSGRACREHSRALSKLEEYAVHRRDIWTEINKLRDWVKAVNDAGLIDQTEGRVRWPWISAIGAFGGVGGWAVGELLTSLFKGVL